MGFIGLYTGVLLGLWKIKWTYKDGDSLARTHLSSGDCAMLHCKTKHT